MFYAAHPSDTVVFFGAGAGVPAHTGVRHLGPLSQVALSQFYRETPISIIFDLVEGSAEGYGWPHGMEASMASAALLFATDRLGLNERNGLHFPPEVFTRVNNSDLSSVVAKLHLYASDRTLLQQHMRLMRERLARLDGVHMRAVDGVMTRAIGSGRVRKDDHQSVPQIPA